MAYALSATKLQTYSRCAKAYWFRYEAKVSGSGFAPSADLGTALHRAIARFYSDWHYLDPMPSLDWLAQCWQTVTESLSEAQVHEGWQILERYFLDQLQGLGVLQRPLGVEGRIAGRLVVEGVEFLLTGRYDLLELRDDGLHLTDFKTGKLFNPPPVEESDLQLGLYQIALEQHYGALQSLSLVHLRSGQRQIYLCTAQQRQLVLERVSELALQIRSEAEWQATLNDNCGSCGYRRFCPTVGGSEEVASIQPRRLQLALPV